MGLQMAGTAHLAWPTHRQCHLPQEMSDLGLNVV